MSKPAVLFYCQHSLGLGHLARSLALAEGLAERFDVVLLNGGRLPEGTRIAGGIDVVNLPPLGHDADGYGLVSHDPRFSVEAAQVARKAIILDTLERVRPRVVLVELYPFGRKKFAFELEPLLETIHAAGASRARVVCSVRDILVTQRSNQARHDEKASRRANAWFDAVLVHADPSFARLEESFHPETPLRVPVHYTGFVAPPAATPDAKRPLHRVLVSAGGGMVGEPLFRAAVAAHRPLAERSGITTTIVCGPFLPEPAWTRLRDEATESSTLQVVRRVDDLCGEIRRSALSVSQCGYNTTMDILRAGTPAVVVPFSEGKEDEQRTRAGRLAALGAVRMLAPEELDGERLVKELCDLSTFRPEPVHLDLTGRETSVRVIAQIAGDR